MYQFWAHKQSGETYAVRIEDDKVTGACGPLHYSEVTPNNLPDFHYDDEAELAKDIAANSGDYRLQEA